MSLVLLAQDAFSNVQISRTKYLVALYNSGQPVWFLKLGWYVVKAVRTSSISCSSVKTEGYFSLMNFSVEYMALAQLLPPVVWLPNQV
jgi:hypothetical protein